MTSRGLVMPFQLLPMSNVVLYLPGELWLNKIKKQEEFGYGKDHCEQ